MEATVRNNVPALTALLTAVSLALVFGAVLGVVPEQSIPRAPDAVIAAIPHANAVISVVAIAVIGGAWRAIRRGNVARHRAGMLTGLALFVAFLGLYLYRVSLEGPTEFPGPGAVERFVYLPILAVHILLAIVCIPLLYYVLLLALSRPVSAIPRTNHRRVGRVAASLWLVSFTLGVVVYALLYVVY
jgi:putative membrane protein